MRITMAFIQGLDYKQTAGDEVEDLMALLAYVKQDFPDLGGVSSGAIASDYQRLRVESVSHLAKTKAYLYISCLYSIGLPSAL